MKQFAILVVEDDEIDRLNIQRAFKKTNVNARIFFAHDGVEALDVIHSIPVPFFILLDINMPRMSGIEFLAELRKDEKLSLTPVVVLTTSKEERDKIQAYKLAVSGYMVKPVEFQDFHSIIQLLSDFWNISEFPKE